MLKGGTEDDDETCMESWVCSSRPKTSNGMVINLGAAEAPDEERLSKLAVSSHNIAGDLAQMWYAVPCRVAAILLGNGSWILADV